MWCPQARFSVNRKNYFLATSSKRRNISFDQRVINADLGVQETKCYAIDVLHA